MTIVLVHGNPETAAVWDLLADELDDRGAGDVVRMSPPGFGAPLPEGFAATVTAYRDWLIGQVEAIGQPVDLVGHDWGGAHVVNVAMSRPDLLRSWVTDAVGVFEPDYVWHDLASTWQQPGAGEDDVARQFGGTVEERAGRMGARGMPDRVAHELAAAQGSEMGRAVLTLYRSAMQPVMADLGRDLARAARRPGLSLLATDDGFVGTDSQRRRAAARAGAGTAVLDGLGHWWMLQDPAVAANALTTFWSGLPSPGDLATS